MTAPRPQAPLTVRSFAQRFSATRRGARLARLLAVHQLTDWGFAPGVGGYDAAVLVVAELSANAGWSAGCPVSGATDPAAWFHGGFPVEVLVSTVTRACEDGRKGSSA